MRKSEQRPPLGRLLSTNYPSRKLRNRLSQQAFRKRQNAYVQELERRLERLDKPNDERIATLEEENRCLRHQIVMFVNRLESASSMLKSLGEPMTHALEGVVCHERLTISASTL